MPNGKDGSFSVRLEMKNRLNEMSFGYTEERQGAAAR